MLSALIGLGVLLMAVGFAGLVRPNAIQRWVASMNPMPRYALAVGLRVALGALLIAVAPEARWPGPTRVFGYIALAAAAVLLFLGPAKLSDLVSWWSTKPAGVVRLASSAGLAVGVLAIVDAL